MRMALKVTMTDNFWLKKRDRELIGKRSYLRLYLVEDLIERKTEMRDNVKKLMDGNEYRRDSVNWYILEGREMELSRAIRELERLKGDMYDSNDD